MEAQPNRSFTAGKGAFVSLLAALLFFVLLWLLDFPKPFIDDLFYCGAGINLAAGGDLSNPLLARQHFPNHYFFVYPPLHSYAVAGWLKLFGISARSLTAFQNAMYFLTALATQLILRRHKSPAWLEWLVPLGVSAAFLPFGLRPDPLSVALTMSGFAIIECGGRRSLTVFFGFLLMFLGGETAPRLTLFSGALVLLAGLRLWQNSNAAGWKRWSFCLSVLGALLAAGFIFLLLIGFRLGEFLETFHFHAAYRVGGGKLGLLKQYLFAIGKTQLPLFFLAPVALLFAWRQPKNEMFHHGTALCVAFGLTALIGGIGHGAVWYAVLMILFLTAAISKNAVRRRMLLPVALALVLLVAASKSLLNIAGLVCGEIADDRVGQYTEALRLRSTPEHPVLVDVAMARYGYDYRMPEGFLDFGFSAPFPGFGVRDFFQPQDVYVISPENIDFLKKKTLLEAPSPSKWSPLGVARLSLYQHPCSAFVIPATSCQALRFGQ